MREGGPSMQEGEWLNSAKELGARSRGPGGDDRLEMKKTPDQFQATRGLSLAPKSPGKIAFRFGRIRAGIRQDRYWDRPEAVQCRPDAQERRGGRN